MKNNFLSSVITQDNGTWQRGFIKPFWSKTSYTKLEYKHIPFNNTKDMQKWNKQGYPKEVVANGALCDMTSIQPPYAKDIIAWFEKTYNLKNIGISFFRMQTACMIPTHKDTYKKYRSLFGCKLKDIRRAIIFLDDWHPGHVFEIEGKPLTNYKKGDFICWTGDTPHMAANIGITTRYTLQITGHK